MEQVTVGQKFNRWSIIKEVNLDDRKDRYEREFLCMCDCGFVDSVNYKNLKYNKSTSCRNCRMQKSVDACKIIWTPTEKDTYYEIPLSNGGISIIDKDDFDIIKDYTWYRSNVGYAFNSKAGKSMHQIIIKTPIGLCTDHINGNKLDNRKNNLRIISRSDHIKHHYKYISSFKKRNVI